MKGKNLSKLALIAMLSTVQAAISLDSQSQQNVAQSSLQDTMKAAHKAYNEGRHAEAIKIAKPLADKGNGDALFLMGFAHENGHGLEASSEKALDYYTKARKNGQRDATYRLSMIYLNAEDKEERNRGLEILKEAAANDPASAGRILGEVYIQGMIDGKPNFDQAVFWWTKASDADDIPSIHGLARLYDATQDFPDKADPQKALALYQKAVSLGDRSAMVAAGSRLLNGSEKIRNIAEGKAMLQRAIEEKQFDAYLALGDYEESVKKDFKAARKQYELGGANQQIDCALRAAEFYFEGKGHTEKSEVKGTEWLRKAAATGNPFGNYRYAAKLLEAPNPDKRKPAEKVDAARRAYDHLLHAAIGGIPQAQNEMGLFYLSGAMGVADPSAAAGWFQRAAQSGNVIAMNNLATLYEKGYGVMQNFTQAGQLFEASARLGNPQAATAVARLLASGIGVKKNIPQALAWAYIADQWGDTEAKRILADISTLASSMDLEEGKKILETLRGELAKINDAHSNPSNTKSKLSAQPAPSLKDGDAAANSAKSAEKP